MAEVQERAPPVLALVFDDDLRLDLARTSDRVRQRCGVEPQDRLEAGIDPVEEPCIGDETVLDDFREPGPQFTRRQVASVAVSETTARGWWKAPIRFLPPG